MGIWVAKPSIGKSDSVVWKRAANREQAGWRAVGGRLFLTEGRLLFQPNRLDALLGGKYWECDLSGIASLGKLSPDGKPFSGGIRTRLRIALQDGSVEKFVVNSVDKVINLLRAATTEERVDLVDERSPRNLVWWAATILMFVLGSGWLVWKSFIFH